MSDPSILLRTATLMLLIIWRLYWHITEVQAEKEKPKSVEQTSFLSNRSFSKYVTLALFGIVGVQLLGIPLFDMTHTSLSLQIVGFILACIGVGMASIGRHNLGSNWARCYDYQVKKHQKLVTHGIYKYIRHPLYSGIALFLIGSELVVQSYLVYLYLFGFIAANQQAKWEEQLLLKHFGSKYRDYMKHTKRFLPFVW